MVVIEVQVVARWARSTGFAFSVTARLDGTLLAMFRLCVIPTIPVGFRLRVRCIVVIPDELVKVATSGILWVRHPFLRPPGTQLSIRMGALRTGAAIATFLCRVVRQMNSPNVEFGRCLVLVWPNRSRPQL